MRINIGLGHLIVIGKHLRMEQPPIHRQLEHEKPTLPESIKHIKLISKGEQFPVIQDHDLGLAYNIHGRHVIQVQ